MVLSLVFFKVVSQDVPSRPVEKVISEYLNIQNFLFLRWRFSSPVCKKFKQFYRGLQSEGMSVKKKAFTISAKISYALDILKTSNVNLQRTFLVFPRIIQNA
jgi:hypothetical protein